MKFSEYDTVRVTRLGKEPESYDDFGASERPPQSGDDGIVVDVSEDEWPRPTGWGAGLRAGLALGTLARVGSVLSGDRFVESVISGIVAALAFAVVGSVTWHLVRLLL